MATIDYIESKINHMKRSGLVTGKHTGLGRNGGACPTWLHQIQKSEDKGKRKITRAMEGYIATNTDHISPEIDPKDDAD